MAYGYNDGDQRPQSVRLAGRTTPTPRSTSDNDNPQAPPRAARGFFAATKPYRAAVRPREYEHTQRQTDTSQPRRYDRHKTDYYVKRSFSRPQRDRGNSAPHPASHTTSHALPARRLRLALCSIAACLVFVFLGSCISHGSAGLEPTAEDKLLKAPVAPGYSFAFSTPRSQWQAGTMPHIYQIDPAWSELPYAGGTIRENACGPTCLTMVYIFKTGHTDKTPVDICALAEAGNYAPTGATEWSFMTGGAWQLGLNGTQLYNDRESITQALRSGAPVIAAVRPGTFTNVGHYIVLYGIDDANQIGVYDPNSASRSARRWGVVEVLNEIEAMWAYY